MSETYEQSDSDLAMNKRVEIFTTRTGSKYFIQALPIDQADEWMDRANAIDPIKTKIATLEQGAAASESAGADLLAARKEYRDAMYACVFAYDPDSLPEEKIRKEGVSPAQMGRAFFIMQTVNDPFLVEQTMKMDMMVSKMKGLSSIPGVIQGKR